MNTTTAKTKLGKLLERNSNTVILPNGTSVNGRRCRLRRSQVYGPGGYGAKYDFSVIITYPSTVPAQRQLMRVDGTWFRILGTEADDLDVSLRVDLGQPREDN